MNFVAIPCPVYLRERSENVCSVRHAEKIKGGGTATRKKSRGRGEERAEGERDGENFTAERLSDLERVHIRTHTYIRVQMCKAMRAKLFGVEIIGGNEMLVAFDF